MATSETGSGAEATPPEVGTTTVDAGTKSQGGILAIIDLAIVIRAAERRFAGTPCHCLAVDRLVGGCADMPMPLAEAPGCAADGWKCVHFHVEFSAGCIFGLHAEGIDLRLASTGASVHAVGGAVGDTNFASRSGTSGSEAQKGRRPHLVR